MKYMIRRNKFRENISQMISNSFPSFFENLVFYYPEHVFQCLQQEQRSVLRRQRDVNPPSVHPKVVHGLTHFQQVSVGMLLTTKT